MPISHKHKIIFLHIPKCAGTTIEKFFGMVNPNNLRMFGFEHMVDGILYSPQHYTSQILKTHKITKKYFNDYYKFTLTRNPFDRVISEFFWQQEIGKIKKNKGIKFFGDWFFKFYKKIDSDHKLPQFKFLYDKNMNLMVDFVGSVETMESDTQKILKNISYKGNKKINKNTKKTTEDLKNKYITQPIKNKIIEIYKEDFELFNYSKE